MATLLMTPIDLALACDGLKVADLPIELVSPHRGEELGRCVHAP